MEWFKRIKEKVGNFIYAPFIVAGYFIYKRVMKMIKKSRETYHNDVKSDDSLSLSTTSSISPPPLPPPPPPIINHSSPYVKKAIHLFLSGNVEEAMNAIEKAFETCPNDFTVAKLFLEFIVKQERISKSKLISKNKMNSLHDNNINHDNDDDDENDKDDDKDDDNDDKKDNDDKEGIEYLINSCDSIQKIAPSIADKVYVQFFTHVIKNEMNEAHILLEKSVKQFPDHEGLLYEYALMNALTGKGDESRKICEKLIQRFQNLKEYSIELARLYFLKSKSFDENLELDEMMESLNRCIQYHPTFVHALFQRSQLNIKYFGRIDESIIDLENIISYNAKFVDAYLSLSQIYSNLDQILGNLSSNLNNHINYYGRVYTFRAKKDIQKAISYLELAIEANPIDLRSYDRLAKLYFIELKDLDKVFQVLDKALNVSKKFHNNFKLLKAMYFFNSYRFNECRQLLNQIIHSNDHVIQEEASLIQKAKLFDDFSKHVLYILDKFPQLKDIHESLRSGDPKVKKEAAFILSTVQVRRNHSDIDVESEEQHNDWIALQDFVATTFMFSILKFPFIDDEALEEANHFKSMILMQHKFHKYVTGNAFISMGCLNAYLTTGILPSLEMFESQARQGIDVFELISKKMMSMN